MEALHQTSHPHVTPARSGSQQGTPSRWTTTSALMDLKEGYNSVQTSERQDTGPGPMKHNPPFGIPPHQQALFKCASIEFTSGHSYTRHGTTGDPKYTGNDPMQAYSHAHCGPSSGSHYKCKDNPVCSTD